MKTYTVYYHKFPNGKMYFGQTCRDVNKRWGKNGYQYKGQTLMWNAIQEYGWDNIEHIIISTGLDQEEAYFQEMFYISAYRTNEREFGYNISSGGAGGNGVKMSDHLKEIHSKRMKENNPAWNMTDEWRKHISESQIGIDRTTEYQRRVTSERMKKNNPMKNPEVAKKVSETQTGKKLSDETKRKIGEARKGRKHSAETINKMRAQKPKFKWLTPDGSIREMDMRNAKVFHKDWIQIKEEL